MHNNATWEYLYENIGKGAGSKVAILSVNGIEVLSVLETGHDAHITEPLFPFIKKYSTLKEMEKQYSKELPYDSEETIAIKRLEAACMLIKVNYFEQDHLLK